MPSVCHEFSSMVFTIFLASSGFCNVLGGLLVVLGNRGQLHGNFLNINNIKAQKCHWEKLKVFCLVVLLC
jgi:uncharacterized membrane protein